MKIFRVNHNTFDAFINTGWEYWGRFKIKFGKEKNEIFQIKGNKFPINKIQELENRYNKP
jgi:hypothetical protein